MFWLFIQVNAYDSVRVVDSLYRSKYFLTSISDFCQDLKSPSSMKSSGRTGDDHSILLPENSVFGDTNSQREVSLSANSLHKVTILNLPEEDANPSNESQTNNMQGKAVFPGGDNEGGTFAICSDEVCMPILPWINGDGTINKIVYKGLQRRILGIVMQNPGILEVHAFFICAFVLQKSVLVSSVFGLTSLISLSWQFGRHKTLLFMFSYFSFSIYC